MRTVKKAILTKSYASGSNSMDIVCYRTSAYWPVGTVVEIVSSGRGKGSIVKFPSNQYDPFFSTTARKNNVEFKLIKG